MITASVIIPTYNYGQFISQAIDSVINQTYPSDLIEIIVVDDGSSDNTMDVLQTYINTKTIKYYYQENKGKANATSFAIKLCTGKYIFNLDADDFFYPEKIERSIKIFETDAAIVHVATPARFINESTQISGNEKLPDYVLHGSIDGNELLTRFYNDNILFGGGTTYSARASVLKCIDIPDESDMYIDELLILAILPFGKSFFIHEPLSVWRIHNSNYSGKAAGKEKQIQKGKRLVSSSEAVLSFLYKNNFDKDLISIYKLQNATRKITLKETSGEKSISDIITFLSYVLLEIKPNFNLIKKYNILPRLIPLPLYLKLKKIKNSI